MVFPAKEAYFCGMRFFKRTKSDFAQETSGEIEVPPADRKSAASAKGREPSLDRA